MASEGLLSKVFPAKIGVNMTFDHSSDKSWPLTGQEQEKKTEMLV